MEKMMVSITVEQLEDRPFGYPIVRKRRTRTLECATEAEAAKKYAELLAAVPSDD